MLVLALALLLLALPLRVLLAPAALHAERRRLLSLRVLPAPAALHAERRRLLPLRVLLAPGEGGCTLLPCLMTGATCRRLPSRLVGWPDRRWQHRHPPIMAARLGACLQLPRTIMEGDLKVYSSCTVVFSPFLLLLRSTKNLNNR